MKTVLRIILVPPYALLTVLAWPAIRVLGRDKPNRLLVLLVVVPLYLLLVIRGYVMILMGYASLDPVILGERPDPEMLGCEYKVPGSRW